MSTMSRLLDLIQTHLTRYPASEIMDVYKLLHQATFGPGHLIANKKNVREWLERESELLTPAAHEPLVENIHPAGRDRAGSSAPLSRPYAHNLKGLLDAFVRSAEQVQGDQETDGPPLVIFRGRVPVRRRVAGRFDVEDALLFGRIRGRESWPAMHHSPAYVAAYKPYYRVLTRA